MFVLNAKVNIDARTYLHKATDGIPPVMSLAFQTLNFLNGKLVFLFQTLNDSLVVVPYSQLFCQLATYSVAATPQLAIDGDDKFFVPIHNCCFVVIGWLQRYT